MMNDLFKKKIYYFITLIILLVILSASSNASLMISYDDGSMDVGGCDVGSLRLVNVSDVDVSSVTLNVSWDDGLVDVSSVDWSGSSFDLVVNSTPVDGRMVVGASSFGGVSGDDLLIGDIMFCSVDGAGFLPVNLSDIEISDTNFDQINNITVEHGSINIGTNDDAGINNEDNKNDKISEITKEKRENILYSNITIFIIILSVIIITIAIYLKVFGEK